MDCAWALVKPKRTNFKLFCTQPTPYKIKGNFLIFSANQLTQAILSPRPTNFLRNSTINFRLFLYLVTCIRRVTVFRCCAGPKLEQFRLPSLTRQGQIGTCIFDKLATDIGTKLRLSGNMLPNIKACYCGWQNFSENLRVVAIKLLELTQFASPNHFFLNFVRCLILVQMRFSVHSQFTEKFVVDDNIRARVPHFLYTWGMALAFQIMESNEELKTQCH